MVSVHALALVSVIALMPSGAVLVNGEAGSQAASGSVQSEEAAGGFRR